MLKKAILCGKLFDSVNEKVVENQVVIVDGERIADVVPLSGFSGEGYEVIDLKDKFVLPGLIDCHMHLTSTGAPNSLASKVYDTHGDMALLSLKNAQKHLHSGFTTIRNLGSGAFVDVAVKSAINRGMFFGPRIVASGPCIGSTGGHVDSHFNPYLYEQKSADSGLIVDSPDEARKAARYAIKHGADVVKFMSTGGVMSKGTTLGAQQLTFDEIRAITEIAEMYGVHTATHAHGTNGMKAAVKAGVTSVEHGMIMDGEVVELMAKNGTYLSPTIIAATRIVQKGVESGIAPYSVEKAKQALEKHEWGFRECLKAGVKIVFGTDCGTPFNLHGEQYDEFTFLCNFGMNSTQALVAATKTSAQLLRMWDDVGSLCKGKYADVVAIDGDPVKTMKEIEKVSFVMKGGAVYR